MRVLMLFAIGFAATCVLAAYLLTGPWLLLLALVCLASVIPLFLLKKRPCRMAAVILLGCLVGFLWRRLAALAV